MESDCSTVSAFVEKDESEDKFALVEIFRFFVNLTKSNLPVLDTAKLQHIQFLNRIFRKKQSKYE